MKRKKHIAVVHCAGGARLNEGIDRASLPKDCSQIMEQYPDGILSCSYGCLGGGSCVAACRLHALSINEKGVAEVDREICVGCGLCVKACPKHLIRLEAPEGSIQPKCSNEQKAAEAGKACTSSCIGCKICEKYCPSDAIHVIGFHAVIDREKCIACGMCATKCPRGVIHDADGIFAAK